QVCAEYAAQACPFLSRPHMHRREAGMPGEVLPAAGIGIMRNPGCVCLWVTRTHTVELLTDVHGPGNPGYLFHPGEPDYVAWYCEGRIATRDEAFHSLETGLPLLTEMAHKDG